MFLNVKIRCLHNVWSLTAIKNQESIVFSRIITLFCRPNDLSPSSFHSETPFHLLLFPLSLFLILFSLTFLLFLPFSLLHLVSSCSRSSTSSSCSSLLLVSPLFLPSIPPFILSPPRVHSLPVPLSPVWLESALKPWFQGEQGSVAQDGSG